MFSIFFQRLLAAGFLTIAIGTVAAKADVETLGLYLAVGQPVTIEELDAILNARYASADASSDTGPPEDIAYGTFLYLSEPNWSAWPPVAFEIAAATPVPEPSTWAMMLIGFAGLGYAGWRTQRKTAALAA